MDIYNKHISFKEDAEIYVALLGDETSHFSGKTTYGGSAGQRSEVLLPLVAALLWPTRLHGFPVLWSALALSLLSLPGIGIHLRRPA